MEISLANKSVLVTGGSQGIGKAAVEALAKAGAHVFCHYNNSEGSAHELAESYPTVIPVQAGLNSASEVMRLADRIFSEGGIDILINNAGIARESAMDTPWESWVGDWDETLAVNLRAPALLSRRFIPLFEERGGGVIINVSSRAAHRGDTRDYLAYAASKGGMEALTKSLARAYGKRNILVYGIAPGFTKTRMAQDFIDKYGEDYATSDIALTELTTPEDIAPLFVFLASGLARHATGSTIDVNAASYVR
jgi:NAD(P)-dependent dehydrogenase (short-subunit alcohol dehydrogenase family)